MTEYNNLNNISIEFKFKCFNCETEFPVYFGYLKDKTNIWCPNCNQEFPMDVLETLKTSISNLETAIKSLELSNEYKSGWNFHINWHKSLSLPKIPGQYDHLGISLFEDNKEPFDLD